MHTEWYFLHKFMQKDIQTDTATIQQRTVELQSLNEASRSANYPADQLVNTSSPREKQYAISAPILVC